VFAQAFERLALQIGDHVLLLRFGGSNSSIDWL